MLCLQHVASMFSLNNCVKQNYKPWINTWFSQVSMSYIKQRIVNLVSHLSFSFIHLPAISAAPVNKVCPSCFTSRLSTLLQLKWIAFAVWIPAQVYTCCYQWSDILRAFSTMLRFLCSYLNYLAYIRTHVDKMRAYACPLSLYSGQPSLHVQL